MSDLVRWFQERPVWLQEAARRMASGDTIDDDALTDLTRLATLEAAGSEALPEIDVSRLDLTVVQTADLALRSLGPVAGINLLSPREPLILGEAGITVIYGENGSGKSGYVRILKHMCGARNLHELLPSAFDVDPPPSECHLSYQQDNEVEEVVWRPEMGAIPDLQSIDVFDRHEGNLLASEEADVSYEPPVLQFLSALAELSARVADRLRDDLEKLPPRTLVIPDDLKESAAGKWFQGIEASIKDTEVEDRCRWTDEDENEWNGVKERLAEKSPSERAARLGRVATNLTNLLERLDRHYNQLSDSAAKEILKLRETAEDRERLSSESATVLARTAPLPGVGSDVWKAMWEQARRYSEEAAYLDLPFPNVEDEARCVLCQQPLAEEARERLTSFEDFVAGSLESAAREARSKLNAVAAGIEEVWDESAIELELDAAGITEEAERTEVMEAASSLRKRRSAVVEGTMKDMKAVPSLPVVDGLVTRLRDHRDEWKALSKKLLEDAKGGSRDALIKEERSLRARRWLAEHRDEILATLAQERARKTLEDARSLCDTTVLSRKKGQLAEELITRAFAERFRVELQNLGGQRLPVSLVRTRTERGRALHRLQLEGAQPLPLADVLSEGEYRVISLAAVLADAGGNRHAAPFVFDDPISSLDVEFEERVVRRLVGEAKNRQLIVFTHRLSLLGLVEELAKEEEVPMKPLWIRREHWGAGEPGGVPIYAKNPKSGLNQIVNGELGPARRILKEEGRTEYDRFALGIVTSVRILIERMIEDSLLSGVIKRHRRSIHTLNKLDRLAYITAEDCNFIDRMMTKYSAYMHSQSAEAPVTLPEPDEIQDDVQRLMAWIDEFGRRK